MEQSTEREAGPSPEYLCLQLLFLWSPCGSACKAWGFLLCPTYQRPPIPAAFTLSTTYLILPPFLPAVCCASTPLVSPPLVLMDTLGLLRLMLPQRL